MKTITVSIALIFSLSLFAQTQIAQVEYTETMKMEKIEGPKGMDISAFLPENIRSEKTLIFNGKESVYLDKEDQKDQEETEMTSDDGSFQIKFMREDSKEILYMNFLKNKRTHQQAFMGKSFVITDSLKKLSWKIGTDKISYLGYECTKATSKNSKGDEIVAWFSSQIPVQCGPHSYYGLPGLILMVSINEGKREIKATSLQVENVPIDNIRAPNDGKKVSQKDFEKIQEEKMKEMEQQYGGKSIFLTR